MTKEKGRGVFASRFIKKKELIVAEKACVFSNSKVSGFSIDLD